MAVVTYSNRNRFIGLSTDEKPTGVPIGATFFESDTRALYVADGGVWYLGPAQADGGVAPAPLVAHRVGLQAADAVNYPVEFALNESQHNNAIVEVTGAVRAPVDTNVIFTLGAWFRSPGGAPVKAGTVDVTARVAYDPFREDVDVADYGPTDVVDNGQDFTDVKPDDDDTGSRYVIIAAPAALDEPSFFGWAAPGGVPTALNVRAGHLDGDPAGWKPDEPDGTVTHYKVALPNVSASPPVLKNVGGDDVAIVLESVAGLADGTFILDIAIKFY